MNSPRVVRLFLSINNKHDTCKNQLSSTKKIQKDTSLLCIALHD